MKLNPFAKKPGAYFAKIKAEYDDLTRQLSQAKEDLEQARIDRDKKEQRLFRLNQQGSMYYSSPEEKAASFAASAACNLVSTLETQVWGLERRISPLRSIAQGPQKFEDDKRKLGELQEQDRHTAAELERLESTIAKLTHRAQAVQARIAVEMKSASQTLIDAESEFTAPDSLAKAEAELRLVQTSLSDLQAKRAALTAQRCTLPQAIREAERHLEFSRAIVAEIELQEALLPVMDLFARAAVARKACQWIDDEYEYPIEIPSEHIDAARAAQGVSHNA